MILLDVRDETGAHPDVVEFTNSVLDHVAPLIEQVTALPLRSCTVRILDREQYRLAIVDYVDRTLARDFTDAPATPEENRAADKIRQEWAEKPADDITAPAQTLTNADGHPETLLVSDRLNDDMAPLLIHEASHHAQIAESAGIVVPPTFEIRTEHPRDRRPDQLMEGHGDWTTQHVLRLLLGGWPKGAIPFSPREAFVETTTRALGTARWNRIWTEPELVPTGAEIAAPDSWLRRVGL